MMCSSNNQLTVICKVRAQVMSRDEYTGGWLPLPIRGGALCTVMLCKSTSNHNPSNGSTLTTNTTTNTTTINTTSSSSSSSTSAHTFSQNYTNTSTAASTLATSLNSSCIINGLSSTTSNNINNGSESMITPHTEYFIIGKRIEDDKNVLNCCIKRDFIYNKVMPTFHHWKTNNCKFGLTFVTATEARLFDKAIKEAFENMFNNERENTFIYEQEYNEDEDIFMSLDLPAAATASSSIVKSTSQTMASYLFSNSSSQRNEESSYVHLTPNVIPPPSSSAVPPLSTGSIKPSGHHVHQSSKNPADNPYQNVNLDDFSKNSPKLIQKPTSLLLGPNNNNISNNNNNINNNTHKIVIEKPPFLPPTTVNQSVMPLATAPSKKKQTWRKTISANGDTIAPASNNSPAKNPIHQPVKIQNGEKIQCKHCLQYYLPQSSPFSTLPGSRCRFNSYRDQQQFQCNNKSTHTKTKTNVLPSTPTSPCNTVSSKTTDSDKSKRNFLFNCISAYGWFSFDHRNGHKSKAIKDDPDVNGHSKGEKTSKTVKNLCCSLASPSSSTCSYSSCPPTPPTSSNTLSSPASPNYRSSKSNNNNDHHNREHQLQQQNSFKSRRRKKERKKVEDDTKGICEGCDKALKEGKNKQLKCSNRRCLLSFLLPCLLCVRPLKACRHKMKLNQTKFCFCCRSASSQP